MEDPNIKTYKIGNLIIKIDRSKCISCGSCMATAPNTFEFDDDIIAKVKDAGPFDDPEIIKKVPGVCSGQAITVEVVEEKEAS